MGITLTRPVNWFRHLLPKSSNDFAFVVFNPFTPRVSHGDTKVILTFESVDEILKCDHSNETSLAVLSCGVVYCVVPEVILTFESVDEILWCDHSNETSSAALSHNIIYILISILQNEIWYSS